MTTIAARRLALTSLALAAAGAIPVTSAVAPAAAAKKKAPLCEDRPGRDLAAGGDANYRVLRTFAQSKSDPDAGVLRVTSCKLGSRSAKVLIKHSSNLDSFMRIRSAQLGGPTPAGSLTPTTVTIALTVESGSSLSGRVVQYDLKTGAERASVATCDVGTVWVAKSGGFAFVDGTVKIADSTGLHAAPSGAGATDFAVGGDTLYWSEGAVTKSTKLVGAPTGKLGEAVDCG